MKKIIKIDAKLIRAAMSCQPTNDLRHYLNGILLAKNGDIVGTDGHTLCKTFSVNLQEAHLPEDLIVKIDGKIPKTASVVSFEFTEERQSDGTPTYGHGIARCVLAKSEKIFSFTCIDGRFPDYKRVIPTRDTMTKNGSASPLISGTYNPAYIGRSAVFTDTKKIHGVTLHMPNDWASAMTITPDGDDWPWGTVMVIMPMRAINERAVDGGTSPEQWAEKGEQLAA